METPDLKRQYERFYEVTLEYNTAMRIARDEGMSERLANGMESIVSFLRERGIDESLLKEALEALSASRCEAGAPRASILTRG